MARVTIQILEGLERGRIYESLLPPLTIGREEENAIRLNDERVSRYHVKIQVDGGRLILTDLDSTNGTRVNGHPVQLRVLQVGDLIEIGRCMLLFGSPAEIQHVVDRPTAENTAFREETTCLPERLPASGERETAYTRQPGNSREDWLHASELFPHGAPDAPEGLRPHQQAAVSDILAYVHEQLRIVLQSAEQATGDADEAREYLIHRRTWGRLVSLQAQLATLLRRVAEPKNAHD